MEEWQREYIRKNLLALVENTICSEQLIDRLFANGTIDTDDKEELEFLQFRPVIQVKTLYEILMKRSHAYDAITAALLANQQVDAYNILNQPIKTPFAAVKTSEISATQTSDEPIYANLQFHKIYISPPSPTPPTSSPLPSPVPLVSRNTLHIFKDKIKQKRSRSLSPSAVFHKMKENIGNFLKSNIDISNKVEHIRKEDIGSPTGFRHVSHFPRPCPTGFKSNYTSWGNMDKFSEQHAVSSLDNNFAQEGTTRFANIKPLNTLTPGARVNPQTTEL